MYFNQADLLLNSAALLIESADRVNRNRLVAKTVGAAPGEPDPPCDLLLVMGQEAMFALTFVTPQWHQGIATFHLDRAFRNHEMLMIENDGVGPDSSSRLGTYFVFQVVETLTAFSAASDLGAVVSPEDPIRFIPPSSIQFDEQLTAAVLYDPADNGWRGISEKPVGAFSTWLP